jgi:hypothetical protein
MLKGQAKPAPFSLSESVLLGKEIFLVQSYFAREADESNLAA